MFEIQSYCYATEIFTSTIEGQEEAKTTKEDVKDASGEGEQECWFGEGGCLE